jgi:hypothetical protein
MSRINKKIVGSEQKLSRKETEGGCVVGILTILLWGGGGDKRTNDV